MTFFPKPSVQSSARMLDLILLEHPEKSIFWGAAVTGDSEMATEDPLALDYVAQQVGMLLLPPFTTRSTRAQGFAMVAYGLHLVERAIDAQGLSDTDEIRRELFERWERFWALATLEHRGGPLPRGDRDAMRGVRGAQRAWSDGSRPLPLDFQMISRQQELGSLGAYLVPLRRSGLVVDGTVITSPNARAVTSSSRSSESSSPSEPSSAALSRSRAPSMPAWTARWTRPATASVVLSRA